MNSAPVDPLIGRTLDERYVVRSKIARGGMATVYLGNDLRLQRRVAIKVMHQHLVEDENFTRRFEREARSAAMLGNSNVVGVFDQGIDGGLPYLVMEYLPGITLRELLKQQRRLTSDQALEIGEAVLTGLAAAHAAGLVHRDLKPENVLLADDGRIKIGDFGLARAVSANTTTGQALLGTIAYLSPELVTRGVADARSDIYAFGIMLFELLTGQQPFKGEQAMQIAYQHAHSEVPAPSTLDPAIDPELDRLVLWCTRRDPDQRPHDAGEALEFMRGMRSGAQLGQTRVLPVTGMVGTVTPSTTVLSGSERASLAKAEPPQAQAAETGRAPEAPETAVERARGAGSARARRGRWAAVILVLLVALAGGAGWWWGQGPGSLVTIPDVVGQKPDAAAAALKDLTLTVKRAECSSLEIEKGLVESTSPKPGARVDRGSGVRLCVSSGPKMLTVPELNGLSRKKAVQKIEKAGFVFGEVVEERFDKGTRDTVFLAVDEEDHGLGARYPEQGVINLHVSAGPLPSVAGDSVAEATRKLDGDGLKIKKSMNTKSYSDTVPEGDVIGLNTGKTVRVGSKVGLDVSRGPQLYAVPDVKGMNVNDAVQALRDAHFEVDTGVVPEGPLGDLVVVRSTDPKAGTKLKAGTVVKLQYRGSPNDR